MGEPAVFIRSAEVHGQLVCLVCYSASNFAGSARTPAIGGTPLLWEAQYIINRNKLNLQNLQPAPSIVEGRRKKLFPNLRRFVVDDDLKVSEGRVARNVLSESMSAQ
jgi:hypothetical protein